MLRCEGVDIRLSWERHQSRALVKKYGNIDGRDMAQAVSRRPSIAEARVRSRVSPRGICGGQSGTGTGFSPSTSVFPRQFHSTGAPLHGKTKKTLIIFITGLHNKPLRLRCVRSVCCGAFRKRRQLSASIKCNVFGTRWTNISVSKRSPIPVVTSVVKICRPSGSLC